MTTTSLHTATRWSLLDSLRGFALAGILLVNGADIVRLGAETTLVGDDPVREVLHWTVQTRFVPIFAFLFGMSLQFVLASARRRSGRPGPVLVRRMVALGLIGGLLWFAYPGNILIEYGVIGLLLVPVVLLAPSWLVLALGVASTAAAYAVLHGGLLSVPGLMLLGAGAAGLGLPQALERAGRGVTLAFLAALAASVPALLWQLQHPGDPRFTVGSIAGVVLAAAYVLGFSLLWRTRARGALSAVFDPLGRMALTNYVVGALVFFAAAGIVDFRSVETALPTTLIALAVIAAQSVASRLWLRRFRYGPIEWVWRTATWWTPAAWRAR